MKLVAITLGDAAGIGPEIIAKAFRDAPQVTAGCFVVGDVGVMRRAVNAICAPGHALVPVVPVQEPSEALALPPRCIDVLQPQAAVSLPAWGEVSAGAGRLAANCVV